MGLKLTNAEIQVLVGVMEDALKQEVRAYNKVLLKDKSAIADAKKWHKVIAGIPDSVRSTVCYNSMPRELDILRALVAHKEKSVNFIAAGFRNKIILAAMECETPAQLKKKLGIKEV